MTAQPTASVETLAVRIAGLEKLLNERAAWQASASATSERALEAYKEAANHMRGMLSDAQTTYLTKDEYNARHQALEQAISDLARRTVLVEGTSNGRRAGITDLVIIFGVIINFIVGSIGAWHALAGK